MEKDKEYFAFISYQRKDEEWADRLRNKLEHYRMPSSVRKQDASLPKEIRPIFRDALELAGGVLAKEIETALQQSKFLIVICSPSSAKSPWVNKEIQTFIDLGREDRIIPFIIDGTPFSDNEDTECFPTALRSLKGEKELLGININELNSDAAAIKVIARMFGLNFDTLWQRYEREKRRKRWAWLYVSFLFGLLGVSIGGYFVSQNKIIENQNESLKKDSVLLFGHLMRIQNDSIRLSEKNDSIFAQTALIQEQRDSLFSATNELMVSNRLLAEERDNVLRNQSRYIARQIEGLIDEGDFIVAQKLSKEILTGKYPYTAEAAAALMKSTQGKSAIFHGHTDHINSVKMSPDGNEIVSASKDGTIRLWNMNGKCVRIFHFGYKYGEPEEVRNAVFSPNGQLIVSYGYGGDIKIWNKSTGECIHTITIDRGFYLQDVDFWSNSKVFACYLDIATGIVTLRLYNIEKEDYVEDILKNERDVTDFSFSHDRSLMLTVSRDSCVKIWNMKTLECLQTIKHDSYVWYANFNNDKSLIVSTCNEGLRIWDVQRGNFKTIIEPKRKRLYYGHAFFSPNQDNIIVEKYVYSLDGEFKYSLKWGRFLESSFNNEFIIGISNDSKGICIAEWDNGNVYDSYLFNKLPTYCAAYANNDNQLFITNDSSLSIWDKNSKKCIRRLPVHDNFTLSMDKRYLVSFGDSIRIWSTTTWKCLISYGLKIKTHLISAKLSPNNELLAVVTPDVFFVYNIIKDETILKSEARSVNYLSHEAAFSHSGTNVAACQGNGIVHVYNLYNGKIEHSIKAHEKYISDIEFSPDDKMIATASWDNTIKLWSTKTGLCVRTLYGHSNAVTMLRYANHGKWLISTSYDRTIKVWDVISGICLKTIHGDFDSAEFSDDCSYILASSHYTGVYLLPFPSLRQLIEETRERLKNNPLTPEERQKYYIE